MAGYTRQSTGSIINGSPITAPPLNSEFNQLAAAFNSTTGHGHTGGTGDSPKINLTTSVSGYLPIANGGLGGKNKLDATTTPAVTNDVSEGYVPGSMWENVNTGRIYICVGNASGAAVWRELVQVTTGNAIIPAANDTVDLGNNSTRFQDLFLSGGISSLGNISVGGTLNVTGSTALGSTLGVTGDTTLVNLSATGTTVINSIDLNSGAIDSTTIGTTTPAAGTFTTLNANTSLVAATADINGGTVDGATIGASTPSTGAFTTLGASGTSTLATVDINGGNIDGTVIGASTKAEASFTTIQTTGAATLASADINGGTVDGATIGATTASSGAFTTVTASGGITGALTGNVTGNVTGNLSGGNVTGNVTGDLTGNVTAGSGTSTFTNVTVNGNLNMNAGTSATITNLTAPSADLDAATKKYVDDEISTLIGDAGAGLDTLGELADALNDDDDFSTTVTNSIATKLPLAGGTMSGAIAMGTNKITGAGDPTAAQDVSTKVYTDTQRDSRVAKSGDTMSGALAMGSNKITGLGTPTAGTDASNKSYVDGILGSGTAASASAAAAATSESNAATSETNAANSATAAASSATSAAASLDSFDDRYLGAKSSAPATDNDGDALIVGALYFDSTAGAMKVYSANGWTNAGSSVNGTTNRYSYTATAGQTVFAATYDSGYVDIFLNGVKQLVGTDVTATSGTSVVFASGTTVNDIVEIVGYGTFVLADHLTQTQSDARYVNLSGDTMTGNLSFGDNNTARFGDGNDLTVDHSGSSGRIFNGTGNLLIRSNEADSDVRIQGDDQNGSYAEYFQANGGTGAAELFFAESGNSSVKLKTTSTGVDVTGDITNSGRVGINTDSPLQRLHVFNASSGVSAASSNSDLIVENSGNSGISILTPAASNGQILFGDPDDNDVGRIQYNHPDDYMAFYTGATERLRITNEGSFRIGTGSTSIVGIGSDSRKTMVVGANTGGEIIAYRQDNAVAGGDFIGAFLFGHDDNNGTEDHFAGMWSKATSSAGIMDIHFAGGTTNYETDTPQMTLKSTGDLLVGKASADLSLTGIQATSSGQALSVTRDGGAPFNLNRKSSDGEIAGFYKDTVKTGAIGVQSSDLVIYSSASGHEGLRLGNGAIVPTNNTGVTTDNACNLGSAGGRFTDVYLGGGVYLGGTGAANKLDDYEEGTFQMTAGGVSGGAFGQGKYVKVGALVHWQWYSNAMTVTGGHNATLAGLPFATSSSSGVYSAFTSAHNTYSGTVTTGYLSIGSVYAYFVTANSTASAPTIGGYPKYVIASGTYFTDA